MRWLIWHINFWGNVRWYSSSERCPTPDLDVCLRLSCPKIYKVSSGEFCWIRSCKLLFDWLFPWQPCTLKQNLHQHLTEEEGQGHWLYLFNTVRLSLASFKGHFTIFYKLPFFLSWFFSHEFGGGESTEVKLIDFQSSTAFLTCCAVILRFFLPCAPFRLPGVLFCLLLLLTMNPTVDFGKPTSFDTALIISYLLHLLGWLFALHIARVLPLKLNGNWISYEPHVNSSTPPKKEKPISF